MKKRISLSSETIPVRIAGGKDMHVPQSIQMGDLALDFQGCLMGVGPSLIVRFKSKDNTQELALKIGKPTPVAQKELCNEIGLLQALQHPHIIKMLYSDAAAYLFVMPVYKEDLHEFIQNHGELEKETQRTIFKGIESAIQFLHVARIVHWDVKAQNVLMDGTVPVVCDFGKAHQLDHLGKFEKFIAGTVLYWPPEYASLISNANLEGSYTFLRAHALRMDTWALGCLGIFITTQRLPFEPAIKLKETLNSRAKNLVAVIEKDRDKILGTEFAHYFRSIA